MCFTIATKFRPELVSHACNCCSELHAILAENSVCNIKSYLFLSLSLSLPLSLSFSLSLSHSLFLSLSLSLSLSLTHDQTYIKDNITDMGTIADVSNSGVCSVHPDALTFGDFQGILFFQFLFASLSQSVCVFLSLSLSLFILFFGILISLFCLQAPTHGTLQWVSQMTEERTFQPACIISTTILAVNLLELTHYQFLGFPQRTNGLHVRVLYTCKMVKWVWLLCS